MLIDDAETFKVHFSKKSVYLGDFDFFKIYIMSKDKIDFLMKLEQDKYSKQEFFLLLIRKYVQNDKDLMGIIRRDQKNKKKFTKEEFKVIRENDKKYYEYDDQGLLFGEE